MKQTDCTPSWHTFSALTLDTSEHGPLFGKRFPVAAEKLSQLLELWVADPAGVRSAFSQTVREYQGSKVMQALYYSYRTAVGSIIPTAPGASPLQLLGATSFVFRLIRGSLVQDLMSTVDLEFGKELTNQQWESIIYSVEGRTVFDVYVISLAAAKSLINSSDRSERIIVASRILSLADMLEKLCTQQDEIHVQATNKKKLPLSISQNGKLFCSVVEDSPYWKCHRSTGELQTEGVLEVLDARTCHSLMGKSIHALGIVETADGNTFFLVGNGTETNFARNELCIWDQVLNEKIEVKPFPSPIVLVRAGGNVNIVGLINKMYILRDNLEEILLTAENPGGLCAMTECTSGLVLVYPGPDEGSLCVYRDEAPLLTISAFPNEAIGQLCISKDGQLAAATSSYGTIIRIFDTNTGEAVKELRRGSYSREIYSLAFSASGKYLASLSDRPTLHVFSLSLPEDKSGIVETPAGDTIPKNDYSSFYWAQGLFAYWGSEWSWGRESVALGEYRGICQFVGDENLYLLANNHMYHYEIDDEAGTLKLLNQHEL